MGRSGGAKYCDQCVCVSVCLSYCPLAYLENYVTEFHEIFCIFYRWPRLGPPPTKVQYVMYFHFGG